MVPTSFPFILSVYLLAGIVVGGAGSILGSIIGGMIVQFVPPLASSVNEGAAGLVLGVVLVVTVMFVPRGIVGSITSIAGRLSRQRDSPQATPGDVFAENEPAKTLEVP